MGPSLMAVLLCTLLLATDGAGSKQGARRRRRRLPGPSPPPVSGGASASKTMVLSVAKDLTNHINELEEAIANEVEHLHGRLAELGGEGHGGDDDFDNNDDNNGGGGGAGPAPPPPPPKSTDFKFSCKKSTAWDGDVTKYAGNEKFCKCGFGGGCPWICSGGTNGSPGTCDAGACSTGIYTFDKKNTWTIDVRKGGGPHRVFAYVPFPGMSAWPAAVKFSFSFKVENFFAVQSVYSKLFFWGDGNNILGLLPAGHAQGGGSSKLIFIPSNDYPNSWEAEMPAEDDKWYHVEMTLKKPSSIDLSVNGKEIGSGKIAMAFEAHNNGGMLGAYLWGQLQGTYKIYIRDQCLGDFAPA